MQSLAEARKGIKTQEGLTMAKNKFQLDRKKADTDSDGKLSKYEEAKGEAVRRQWTMMKSLKWLTVAWQVTVG